MTTGPRGNSNNHVIIGQTACAHMKVLNSPYLQPEVLNSACTCSDHYRPFMGPPHLRTSLSMN